MRIKSKFWVIDPDSVERELYRVNHELIEKHGGGIEQSAARCQDQTAAVEVNGIGLRDIV